MDIPAPATLAIIILTTLVSWKAFGDRVFLEKLIFRPERILAGKEYYRVVTAGFLHGDWPHLFMNMFSLYLFGSHLELLFGVGRYLLIYFGSIAGGYALSLWLHRHHDYSALGASGGVCGVLFAYIFLFPGGGIRMFLFPFEIPAWLFAILFLLAEFFGIGGRYGDNIGHDAHLGGAILGLLLTAGMFPYIVEQSPKLFFAVLGLSGALLAYLIMNPMLLSPRTIWSAYLESRRNRAERKLNRFTPKRRFEESGRMDALLEKISRDGFQSLSEEEKAFLRRMSRK